MPLSMAIIHPDIAGNTGSLLRTAACLGVALHVVEPCGFPFGDRALARAGMDYAARAAAIRHADWDAFVSAMAGRRLVLLTTDGSVPLTQARFEGDDVIVLGCESSGAPRAAHDAAGLRVRIPLVPGMRSLNVAVAGGIAIAEALRQTGGFAA